VLREREELIAGAGGVEFSPTTVPIKAAIKTSNNTYLSIYLPTYQSIKSS